MKVLVITQYFWPENFRINDLACALKEKGHEITILTGKPNYPSGKFYKGYGFVKKFFDEYNGIELVRAPVFPRCSGKFIYLVINYFSFVFFAFVSLFYLVWRNYDVIFVYEPSPITVALPAIWFKKIKKIPVILWIQDLWPESISATGAVKSKFIVNTVSHLVGYIYRRCDLLLVQSMAFIPSIRRYADVNADIVYFPNYAEDIYQFAKDSKNEPVEPLPQGFRVIFAGNIGAAQDFPTILDAAEELKANHLIKWVIVGDGRQFEWVKNEVAKRGLSNCVYLLGQFPLADMPYFYSKSDVMLVTLKKNEIFSYTIPGKIQSYMAAGKPIVGCLDGEGKRVIDEAHAGLIANSGDSKTLARNILFLSELPREELDRYGKNAFEYYNLHFNKENLVVFLEKMLAEVVDR